MDIDSLILNAAPSWLEFKAVNIQDSLNEEDWKNLVRDFVKKIVSCKPPLGEYVTYHFTPYQAKFFTFSQIPKLLQDAFKDGPMSNPDGWEICYPFGGPEKYLRIKTEFFNDRMQLAYKNISTKLKSSENAAICILSRLSATLNAKEEQREVTVVKEKKRPGRKPKPKKETPPPPMSPPLPEHLSPDLPPAPPPVTAPPPPPMSLPSSILPPPPLLPSKRPHPKEEEEEGEEEEEEEDGEKEIDDDDDVDSILASSATEESDSTASTTDLLDTVVYEFFDKCVFQSVTPNCVVKEEVFLRFLYWCNSVYQKPITEIDKNAFTRKLESLIQRAGWSMQSPRDPYFTSIVVCINGLRKLPALAQHIPKQSLHTEQPAISKHSKKHKTTQHRLQDFSTRASL